MPTKQTTKARNARAAGVELKSVSFAIGYYRGMIRVQARIDDSVWAVACFVTRVGFRRRGVSKALARAAVTFARQRGAHALEGYPHISDISHVGTPGIFAAAGFVEATSAKPRGATITGETIRTGNGTQPPRILPKRCTRSGRTRCPVRAACSPRS